MNASLKEACIRASEELGMPLEEVERIYRSYWWSIRSYIKSLELKGPVERQYLQDRKTSFNIPSLGKLYTDYDRIQGVKKRFNYLTRLKNAKYKKD